MEFDGFAFFFHLGPYKNKCIQQPHPVEYLYRKEKLQEYLCFLYEKKKNSN